MKRVLFRVVRSCRTEGGGTRERHVGCEEVGADGVCAVVTHPLTTHASGTVIVGLGKV